MISRFWIEGNRHKVNIHLRSTMDMDSRKKAQILGISREGKNSVFIGLANRVREMVQNGMGDFGGVSFSLKKNGIIKESDGLEKILITKLSDDVLVSVMGNKVEIVVIKRFV